MPVATPDSYSFTPGTPLYAGLPTPSGGGLITTLSLVNTSGSTQAANFVSPMLGMPFKAGDIPSGEFPVFTLEDDTPCPATIYNDTSWPDASKKFCGVLLRAPTSIAGSGTLTVEVKSGGSTPSASSRTLSDLTAADIKVELTGITALSGVWTASLNTAITDADDIVVIGDGPAGKVWRIGGAFKQSGSAHGQLYCWHYVAALQNSSGGFMGIRYLGRGAQPYTDITSPTVAKREFSAVLKSGATTLRTLQGTQSGETLTGTITMPHYTDFYTCGQDGEWDYVQGGGSASADCTIRVQHDKTYFTKSKLVPPYDLTQTPTNMASVNYNPQCKGSSVERNLDGTGERLEIGVMPSWAVRHLMTQSAVDRRAVVVSALAAGGWRSCMRLSSTKQIIPVVDIQSSYTGLGTAQPSYRYFDAGSNNVGVNPRPETHLWDKDWDIGHRPAIEYYAYLITARPEMLDMLVEQAAVILISGPPGGNTWKVGSPIGGGNPISGSWAGERNPSIAGTTYKGAGFLFNGNLFRIMAWSSRDIGDVSAIYPDTCPYGTETRKYFRDVLASGYAALKAYNDALPTSWRDSGLVSFTDNGGGGDFTFESPWALGYWSNAICHLANTLPEIPDLVSFRQHLAKWYSSQNAIAGIATVAAYRFSQWKQDNTRVETAADVVFAIGGTLTPSTSTNRITVSTFTALTNGDVFMFDSRLNGAAKPCAEAVNGQRLYIVNASGNTGQLSLTPGGSVLTLTSNAAISSWFCRVAAPAPQFSYEGIGSNTGYAANIYGAIRHHLACGDTVVSSARTAQDANWAATGSNFTGEPKNAMATAYPT